MLWLKMFRKKKIQSVLIFLIVGMCIFLISGSVIILVSLDKPYVDLMNETKAPDLKLYPNIEPEYSGKDWVTTLNSLKSIKSVYDNKRCSVDTIWIGDTKEDVFVDFCSFSKEMYEKIRMIEGSLDSLTDGKCIIPTVILNQYDLSIGDSIGMMTDKGMRRYEVAGAYADIFSISSAFTTDIIVTELPEGSTQTHVYAVYFNNGYTISNIIDEYTQLNNGVMDGYFRDKESCVNNSAITEKIMGGILLGISTTVFLVILIMLRYSAKNTLRNDRMTIAVYKACGYTNKRIVIIYMMFYESIVLCGSLFGCLCSPLLSNSFMRTAFKNLGIESSISGIGIKAACVIIVCLMASLIFYMEISKLGRTKPVDILTNNSRDESRKKFETSKSNKMITNFSPFAYAVRMLKMEKRNTALIIVTCILSFYIVNISVVCLNNVQLIRGETNYYWLGIDKHDVTMSNLCNMDEYLKICNEVKADKDVSLLVKKCNDASFAIPYHESVSALVYESYKGVDMNVIEGRNPKNINEAAISNIYCSELGIGVGDYISINLDNNKPVRLLITGTYQGFYNMGRGIKVLGGLLEKNNVPFEYKECSVTLKSGVNKKDFIKRIGDKYGDKIKLIDRKNLYSSIMDMICDPQQAALGPFVVIAVCIGAVNLFYIVYTGNIEKRKKYTIYKAIGYTSSYLLRTNCIYVSIIEFIAIALSIPALIFLFPKVMLISMSVFGFAEYNLELNPLLLIATNLSLFVIFILMACVSGNDIYKNHIAEIMNE